MGAVSARYSCDTNTPVLLLQALHGLPRAHLEHLAQSLIDHLDAIDGDADFEEDDPAGQCDEDEINTGFRVLAGFGPGCVISDEDFGERDGARRGVGMITTPGNVIPFPLRPERHREEIQYLHDWRDQIYSNYPTMTELGKCMADVILERIAADLAGFGVPQDGRVA